MSYTQQELQVHQFYLYSISDGEANPQCFNLSAFYLEGNKEALRKQQETASSLCRGLRWDLTQLVLLHLCPGYSCLFVISICITLYYLTAFQEPLLAFELLE